jgi:RNA-binding protein YlmH
VAFTSDKEDKLLLSKAEDALRLSELRHRPEFFGFLNERERYMIQQHLSYAQDSIRFYGGYEGAKRPVMCAYELEADPWDYPITPVYFRFRQSDDLTHRDFLGSLMGLGIERDCVGDIIVCSDCAVCFLKSDIADYVSSQISKIGRAGVRIVSEKECDIDYSENIETLCYTVSSMRLDVIIAAIKGLSREKTAAFILSGNVFVNYSEVKNVSLLLKADDILSVRGAGKYIVRQQSGTTKKGRLKINIDHYR